MAQSPWYRKTAEETFRDAAEREDNRQAAPSARPVRRRPAPGRPSTSQNGQLLPFTAGSIAAGQHHPVIDGTAEGLARVRLFAGGDGTIVVNDRPVQDYFKVSEALGRLMFTEYVFPVQVAGLILLVGMVAAVVLTLRRRKDSKYQRPGEQVRVRRAERLRLVLSASGFRLVGGFALGLATVAAISLLFEVDDVSRRVILLQAAMPAATMATFFGEYVPLDEKLLSGIIAVSTLLSFVTLPLWVLAINAITR